MSKRISRRLFLGSLPVIGGGLVLTGSTGILDPEHLFTVSESLTMATQRLLLQDQPLVREYAAGDISRRFPIVGTKMPENHIYEIHLGTEFQRWKLPVQGLIYNPKSYSLRDLKNLPDRSQITSHSCELGWTAIAQWRGVPLSAILEQASIMPDARYVVFESSDGRYESIDLFDAFHPQTILAYEMNGEPLAVKHGAPLRLRVERHLGYKQLKYICSITVVNSLEKFGNGTGGFYSDRGWSWYAGI